MTSFQNIMSVADVSKICGTARGYLSMAFEHRKQVLKEQLEQKKTEIYLKGHIAVASNKGLKL